VLNTLILSLWLKLYQTIPQVHATNRTSTGKSLLFAIVDRRMLCIESSVRVFAQTKLTTDNKGESGVPHVGQFARRFCSRDAWRLTHWLAPLGCCTEVIWLTCQKSSRYKSSNWLFRQHPAATAALFRRSMPYAVYGIDLH